MNVVEGTHLILTGLAKEPLLRGGTSLSRGELRTETGLLMLVLVRNILK